MSDVVAANVIVLNDKIGTGEIYNLGWGKEITDLEVFQTVRNALSSRVNLSLTRNVRARLTILVWIARRLQGFSGWRPKVPFEEGVTLSVAYYQERIKS